MNRKLVGLILVVCGIGSFAVIYPEQTISAVVAFRDWWFTDQEIGREAAQIWRMVTQNGVNDKDIRIDYCEVTRNGEYLGEPDGYYEGYVEFTLPVFEGDQLSAYFRKEGFFSRNINFTVPDLPKLVGGQTYYTLQWVNLYPTSLLEGIPQQVESDYFVNVLIHQLPTQLEPGESATTIMIVVNATQVLLKDFKIIIQDLPEHIIRYSALISPSRSKLKRFEGYAASIPTHEAAFFRVDLILLNKPLFPICFQLSYHPSQNALNVTPIQIWGFCYDVKIAETWERSLAQISLFMIKSAGGWFYIALVVILSLGVVAWFKTPKEEEKKENE